MDRPTLIDIAKFNGADDVVGLIDEAAKTHPEITSGFARTIRGLNYKTLIRTRNPAVSFRDANEGVNTSVGAYENRLVETYIFNPRWECDKAVADRYEDGADAYIALEASGIMEAAMQHLSSQFYYGEDVDAKGFPGLIAAYDTINMELDAGGTTDETATSVWAVRFGPKDVAWVWGNGGVLDLDDVREESVVDQNNKKFTAYVQELLAYPGLQVGSRYSIARIKKITEDEDAGLTDALLAQLLSKFPAGLVPDMLLMSRRSLVQLQDSRTATNATGAPAPFPTESFGVPIRITDAIRNNETLVL